MTYDNTGLKRELLEGEPLTERELDVLDFAARGDTADETGKRLHLSVETVRSYRKQAMYKLYARNTTHATVLAVGLGYVNVGDLIEEWEEAHGGPAIA